MLRAVCCPFVTHMLEALRYLNFHADVCSNGGLYWLPSRNSARSDQNNAESFLTDPNILGN